MGTRFLKGLERQVNLSKTENGDIALKSTKSFLLDFYSTMGGMRNSNEETFLNLLEASFQEDRLNTIKAIFYLRDVRGGLGERKLFRLAIKYLADNHPNELIGNIGIIYEYGRWDDLYALMGTQLEDFVFKIFSNQLRKDLIGARDKMTISLLAKWLKSVNSSSQNSRQLGYYTSKRLGMSSKQYRKILSHLRSYIDVTEVKMSSNNWEGIVYPSVPSNAMSMYNKAFKRHDSERFAEFMEAVSQGKVKINASTLYPYDLLRKIVGYSRGNSYGWQHDDVVEAQWKALPNLNLKETDVLVVADTSGSMLIDNAMPLFTSLGMAVYFAEKNHGIWKNKFITFSSDPQLVEIKGNTLVEKLNSFTPIVASTDIRKVFDLILNTALMNKLKSDELPKSLVIISDMQFDQGVKNSNKTMYKEMKEKFSDNGYILPNVVFWNARTVKETHQVEKDAINVQLFSGHSVSIFKNILNTLFTTPYESMVQTLSSERYSKITIGGS